MTHRLRASKDVARAKSMRLISLLAHPFSSFLFDAVGYKTLALDLVTQEGLLRALGSDGEPFDEPAV